MYALWPIRHATHSQLFGHHRSLTPISNVVCFLPCPFYVTKCHADIIYRFRGTLPAQREQRRVGHVVIATQRAVGRRGRRGAGRRLGRGRRSPGGATPGRAGRGLGRRRGVTLLALLLTPTRSPPIYAQLACRPVRTAPHAHLWAALHVPPVTPTAQGAAFSSLPVIGSARRPRDRTSSYPDGTRCSGNEAPRLPCERTPHLT